MEAALSIQRHTVVRGLLATLIVLSVGNIAAAGLASPPETPRSVTDELSGTLVVTSHGSERESRIVAYDEDGDRIYENRTYSRYFDVDPVPGMEDTVLYVGAVYFRGEGCEVNACTRNVVERVDLRTGETERIFSRVTPGVGGTRWHDVDHYRNSSYVVADIYEDSVFVYDAAEGETTWRWDAQTAYPISSGGPYPDDWTHVNDVEVLPDGRIMASLRNQDSVVFLRPGEGLLTGMTLGRNGVHDILNEQHNPDYIQSDGTESILVADSQNGRIVEYEREDGKWNRTYVYATADLVWPRDADRLPSGETLVTASNANEVFLLTTDNQRAWSFSVETPYEAEIIETKDESAGASPASELRLESRQVATGDSQSTGGVASIIIAIVRSLIPSKYLNAVIYVLPFWFGRMEFLWLIVGMGSAAALALHGVWHADYSIALQSPFNLQ